MAERDGVRKAVALLAGVGLAYLAWHTYQEMKAPPSPPERPTPVPPPQPQPAYVEAIQLVSSGCGDERGGTVRICEDMATKCWFEVRFLRSFSEVEAVVIGTDGVRRILYQRNIGAVAEGDVKRIDFDVPPDAGVRFLKLYLIGDGRLLAPQPQIEVVGTKRCRRPPAPPPAPPRPTRCPRPPCVEANVNVDASTQAPGATRVSWSARVCNVNPRGGAVESATISVRAVFRDARDAVKGSQPLVHREIAVEPQRCVEVSGVELVRIPPGACKTVAQAWVTSEGKTIAYDSDVDDQCAVTAPPRPPSPAPTPAPSPRPTGLVKCRPKGVRDVEGRPSGEDDTWRVENVTLYVEPLGEGAFRAWATARICNKTDQLQLINLRVHVIALDENMNPIKPLGRGHGYGVMGGECVDAKAGPWIFKCIDKPRKSAYLAFQAVADYVKHVPIGTGRVKAVPVKLAWTDFVCGGCP